METLYNEACRKGCHCTHMLSGRTWYVDKPETPRNTETGKMTQRSAWKSDRQHHKPTQQKVSR